MGYIYLADNLTLERKEIIKVMKPTAIEAGFAGQLIAEAKLIAQLNHNNIIKIYAIIDGRYIAMEYLEGGSLGEMVNNRKLTALEITQILIQICNALAHVHKKGIIHRDLKPFNILFRENLCPVLIDFGIAKKINIESDLTSMGLVSGTPRYMSPERLLNQPINGKTDIYSLGVVLTEMLTLKKFKKNNPSQLKKIIPNQYAHFLPTLKKMLEKESTKRLSIDALEQSFIRLREKLMVNPDDQKRSSMTLNLLFLLTLILAFFHNQVEELILEKVETHVIVTNNKPIDVIKKKKIPLLQIFPNKTYYTLGEKVVFTIKSNHSANLYCYFQSIDKKIVKIFPNLFVKQGKISAQKEITIPNHKMQFEFLFEQKGQENILCLSFAKNNAETIAKEYRKLDFSVLKIKTFEQIIRHFKQNEIRVFVIIRKKLIINH